MLFKTEAEALRFIQYNSEAIKTESGTAPVRAYYCESCCGWHVTSLEQGHEKKNTEKIASKRYQIRKLNVHKILDNVETLITRAIANFAKGLITKARRQFHKAFVCFQYSMTYEGFLDRKQVLFDGLTKLHLALNKTM